MNSVCVRVCLSIFFTPTKFSRNPFINRRVSVFVFWFYSNFANKKNRNQNRMRCAMYRVTSHHIDLIHHIRINKDMTIEIHLTLKSILHRPIIHSRRFQCPGHYIRMGVHSLKCQQNKLCSPQEQNGEPCDQNKRQLTQTSQYIPFVYIWQNIFFLSSIFQYCVFFVVHGYVCHSMRQINWLE